MPQSELALHCNPLSLMPNRDGRCNDRNHSFPSEPIGSTNNADFLAVMLNSSCFTIHHYQR